MFGYYIYSVLNGNSHEGAAMHQPFFRWYFQKKDLVGESRNRIREHYAIESVLLITRGKGVFRVRLKWGERRGFGVMVEKDVYADR